MVSVRAATAQRCSVVLGPLYSRGVALIHNPMLDPVTWDCTRGILLLGDGMRHGPRPTSAVINRSAVGLIVLKLVEHDRKLPEKYSGRTPWLVAD
jgi:hypothetical protein